MMNLNHILIPTDLSVLSLRPIERAPELFKDRIVTLMCALEDVPIRAQGAPFAPPMHGSDLPARITQAEIEMEEIAKVLSSAKEVRIEAFGAAVPATAITEWAANNDIDLIALSTHGRTGLRRMVLGSVAEKILRHATVPVLTFPAGEDA